jgi:transposase InsO family protein
MSARQREDALLAYQIAAAHLASRGSYRNPRIVQKLRPKACVAEKSTVVDHPSGLLHHSDHGSQCIARITSRRSPASG